MLDGGGRIHTIVLLCLVGAAATACSGEVPSDGEQQIGAARAGLRSPGWELLGGDLNPFAGQPVSAPSLVIEPPGTPVLAFSSGDPAAGSQQVFVSRWQRGGWALLGDAFDGQGPALAIDERSAVYACFAPPASAAAGGPLVQRWTDDSWHPLGGDLGAETGFAGARYTVDDCGGIQVGDRHAAIVAWSADIGAKNDAVYAATWRRGERTWSGVGPGAIGGRADAVSLATGARGRVYLATFSPGGSFGGGATTRVWSWDGAAWDQLGADLPGTADPVIGEGYGPPVLAFHDAASGALVVMRWMDGAWSPLPSPGAGSTPALAFTSSGRAVVAFVDDASPPAIRVASLAHGAWRQLGDGVAPAGSGVVRLALAVDDRDRPTVAWSTYDSAAGTSGVFAARYDGSLR